MKRAAALVTLVMLTACTATGVQVRDEQLNHFKKGVTTEREVIAALGSPSSTTTNDSGQKLDCYTYVQSTTRPESFIPYVGMFAGGADVKSNMSCLRFTHDGTLISYNSTTSQYGAGYGLESGTTPQRTPNQPSQAK